jgi:hypothetical protein
MKDKDEQLRAQEIERRKLESKLSREEAILAKYMIWQASTKQMSGQ